MKPPANFTENIKIDAQFLGEAVISHIAEKAWYAIMAKSEEVKLGSTHSELLLQKKGFIFGFRMAFQNAEKIECLLTPDDVEEV